MALRSFVGSHRGLVLWRQGVGVAVPARIPRGDSVDGVVGRRAPGLEIRWKILVSRHKQTQQADLSKLPYF